MFFAPLPIESTPDAIETLLELKRITCERRSFNELSMRGPVVPLVAYRDAPLFVDTREAILSLVSGETTDCASAGRPARTSP